MSATISLPPGVAPAQPALNGSNASASADGAGGMATDAGNPGSFAALFQQLTGRQLVAAAPVDQVLAVQKGDTAVASDELTAILPFLEAMGLLPATPEEASAGTLPLDADVNRLNPDIDPQGLAKNVTVAPLQADVANDDAAISAARPLPGGGAQASLAALPLPSADGKENPALVKAADPTGQPGNPANDAQSRFASALQAAGDRGAAQHAAPPLHTAGTPVPQTQNAAPPALPVAQPVGGPGWNQEVGNRIVWMASRMESRAELVLTPPQMGRVEVSLSVNGDHASASFVSANPAVREALEAAMPRLREVLAEAGIQLGQAQVGAENARQSAQQEKNGDNFGADRAGGTAAAEADTDGESAMPPAALKPGLGLVDTFA